MSVDTIEIDQLTLSNDFSDILSLVMNNELDTIKNRVIAQLEVMVKSLFDNDKLNLVFLYDTENSISDSTSNSIYRTVSSFDKNKPLLLLLNSYGGNISPAYFISKCCRDVTNKFIITIPKKAKSAATLIALGADEIHMGSLSELGPIDPQINGMPLLGVKSAFTHIANICVEYPTASDMFAKYLSLTVRPDWLGYSERIAESAKDYAIRLLRLNSRYEEKEAIDIANQLVYGYKDHGFAIDCEDAKKLLVESAISLNQPDFQSSIVIDNFLERVDICLRIVKKHALTVVGQPKDIWFSPVPDKKL